jgi:hypothetical protein
MARACSAEGGTIGVDESGKRYVGPLVATMRPWNPMTAPAAPARAATPYGPDARCGAAFGFRTTPRVRGG